VRCAPTLATSHWSTRNEHDIGSISARPSRRRLRRLLRMN
jgi:hypothetical protein